MAAPSVQIKDPTFRVISRQRTLTSPTNLTKVIFQEAMTILRTSWQSQQPIRLLTVTASTLCGEDEEYTTQLSFFDDMQPNDPRQLRLEQAVDEVRKRYGRSIISPGTPKVE